MVLKIRLQEESEQNIEILKKYFYPKDRITAGYIIGLAVDKMKEIPNDEWIKVYTDTNTNNESKSSEARSTSISLRQNVYDLLNKRKEQLEINLEKSLHMSQVVDLTLSLCVKKLVLSNKDIQQLVVIEWSLNAQTGFNGYIMPVKLIADQILTHNPHIFIFTEFVKSAVGWIELKSILEETYMVYESPYMAHKKENGIVIGIRRNCGFEILDIKTKDIIFNSSQNAPNFLEVNLRINREELSIIGTRIVIESSKIMDDSEHKQRFEQFSNLIEYVKNIENAIVLGDFNNSKIHGDEMETNKKLIQDIYKEFVQKDYNLQMLRAHVIEETDNRFSLYTESRQVPCIGASWDSRKNKAIPPMGKKNLGHKYDHLITNFKSKNNVVYNWDFLKSYTKEEFGSSASTIKRGVPDHSILVAEILLNKKIASKETMRKDQN